jgi:hypothetical protein
VACASEDPVELLTAIHESTGEKFMFVVDDWDFIFKSVYSSEPMLASRDDKMDYLKFLHELLMGKHVLMAYMTGVLPLPLPHYGYDFNSFTEHPLSRTPFRNFFGFDGAETQSLFELYKTQPKNGEPCNVSFKAIEQWYLYGKVYNPYSTIRALKANKLDFYWHDAAPKGELLNIIKSSLGFGRKLASLLSLRFTRENGTYFVQLPFDESDNDCNVLSTLTAFGYLHFYDCLFLQIPNLEIRYKLKELVKDKKEYSYIYELSNAFPKLRDLIFSLDKQGVSSLFEEKLHSPKQIFFTGSKADREAMMRLAFSGATDYTEYDIDIKKQTVGISLLPKYLTKEDAVFFEFLDDDMNTSVAIRELKADPNKGPLGYYLDPGKPFGTAKAFIVAISCDGSDGAVSCDIEVV